MILLQVIHFTARVRTFGLGVSGKPPRAQGLEACYLEPNGSAQTLRLLPLLLALPAAIIAMIAAPTDGDWIPTALGSSRAASVG